MEERALVKGNRQGRHPTFVPFAKNRLTVGLRQKETPAKSRRFEARFEWN